MKNFILSFLAFSLIKVSTAQTVFTYGKHAVTKDEFVRAFDKNPGVTKDRKKALKEYLDLYINFKLKVQAAYDEGLNKDGTQQYELENFKKQVAENIINEEANLETLVEQAFERSQKEIKLQQVFIEFPGSSDTLEAHKKIQAAYSRLREGKDFGDVSQEYSSDEQTKRSKGELGFITVFTLPYNIESRVYNLKVNAISEPIRSSGGYHIFKNTGERTPSGSRKVAQILIALPANPTEEDRKLGAAKADSIHKLLSQGADFGELASTVSNDLSSSSNGGQLPELTIGTYDANFEKVAFSLPQGEISKPFLSAFGYHILKILEVRAPPDKKDPIAYANFQEQVLKDNRLAMPKKELIQKKLSLLKFKSSLFNPDDLYIFTDSCLKKGNNISIKGINENTTLFSFAKQNVRAGDWLKYVRSVASLVSDNHRNNYKELYKKYIHASAEDYYRKHLDIYNPDYSKQLKEFTDANLLFGIMEQRVWGRANTDTLGLLEHYKQHKSKYRWNASADAIIVTCNNENLASTIRQLLVKDINNWRQVTGDKGTSVIADSSRFELTQLVVPEKTDFIAGLVTTPVKNNFDGTYTFTGIVRMYNEGDIKSFEDARGMIIADYQQVLEDKWINELKKKYPVKVNEAIFQTLK